MRDRVVELRRVPAGEVRRHPLNFQTHPDSQKSILRDAINDIGFASAAIGYENDEGEIVLIDGHLRTESVPQDAEIPVLILDVTEDEAKSLLATMDPIAKLAEVDYQTQAQLLMGIESESEHLNQFIANLASFAAEQALSSIPAPEPVYRDPAQTPEHNREQQHGMVSFSCVFSESQNELIRNAINQAKSKFGAETTPEAIYYICQEWIDQ